MRRVSSWTRDCLTRISLCASPPTLVSNARLALHPLASHYRTGSFKAGYTTGIIATHPNDIGPVKGVSVNWLPNSYMTLLYGENLFVEDVRVAPIAWDETK